MSSLLQYSADLRLPLATVVDIFRQLRNVVAREHGNARRRQASVSTTRLLDWAQKHLPHYFRHPPSRMHRSLAAHLDHLVSPPTCRSGTPVPDNSTCRPGTTVPDNPTVPLPVSASPPPPSRKLNLLAPRGAAKSTLGTLAFVLKAALEKVEPYIWIISDTKHQACAHLENIKNELVENRSLAKDYAAAAVGPTWRQNRITLNNGVTIEAFGVGQRLRGRRYCQHRPTLIVCDDLQNDNHMLSATQRDRSRSWFHGTLMKAGTAATRVLNLATALHRDALAMQLHRTPGWTSHLFKAIVRWPDNMSLWQQWESIYTDLSKHGAGSTCRSGIRCLTSSDSSSVRHQMPDLPVSPSATPRLAARRFYEEHRVEMDAGAVLLWPEHEDLYTLMCMRVEEGYPAFEREKQNSPVNPDLCEWPESYFDESIWFEAWPANLLVKTMALDPSKGTDSRRGDYSALVRLGVDRQGILYVEADLARQSTPAIVAEGVERFRCFQPDVFAIEANQFQDLLADQFELEFRRQGMLSARPFPLENQAPKQVRIRRLGRYLATRRLRFKSDSPSTRLLVEQLMQFPIADHDDGPDALEMAIRIADEFLAVRHYDDGLGDRLPIGT